MEWAGSRGPLRFDRFMRVALTDPAHGYYTAGPERTGRNGDFITSPEISAAFGECLGVQIAEMLARIGPGPRTIVELGAGNGSLALDVVRRLPPELADLTVLLVEASSERRASQRRLFERHAPVGCRLTQAASLEEARRLAPGPLTGVVYSNEYFDALPVRVVRRSGETLEELFVATGDERLVPAWQPAEERLRVEAARWGAAPADGVTAELGLEAAAAASEIASWIGDGYHLIVDYGWPAAELYAPELRPSGTLLAYSEHRTNEEIFEQVGRQDLTAHVNFSALEDAGAAQGLVTEGFTTQDRFLVALGLADRIVQLAASMDPAAIRKRLSLMMLMHPSGMGRTFKILVQSRGVRRQPLLAGLADPFARPVEGAEPAALGQPSFQRP